MPVSYAGVPLITVTAQAAAWVDAALDTDTINLFQFRHDKSQTQQRLSIPNKETRYKPRLGSLMWPSGSRRWATALFTVTTDQLAAIKTAVGYPASYGAATLVISDGTSKSGRGITASNMWMLPSYPAIQVPGTNGLYLLTLVDQRYWWWYTIASLAVTYGGSPTTYTALIHQALSSVAVDSTNSKYQTPGMAHNGVDEYIALLLDSIAYNCGERIRVDLAGNVYSYTAATALARTNTNLALSNLALTRGGYIDATELSGYLPHTIEVDFPGLDSGGTTNKTATTNGLHTQTKLFRSTGISNEDSIWNGGTTTLQDFTNQFAADWYSWQLSNVEATYAGIVTWNPVGLEDMVEWRCTEDEVSTRVSRGPVQDLTEDLLHAVPISPVVMDVISGRVLNVETTLFSGATVSHGIASEPQNVAEVTIDAGSVLNNSTTSYSITTNPTITFNSGGSLTLNGPIFFCGASTVTYGGPVYYNPIYAPTLKAKVGSSPIAAISGVTPGSDTVAVYKMVGGTLTDASLTVTAYNNSFAPVPDNVFVDLIQDPFTLKYFITFSAEGFEVQGGTSPFSEPILEQSSSDTNTLTITLADDPFNARGRYTFGVPRFTLKGKNGNSAISPCSGTTPGSGTVELYTLSGGVLTDTSTTVTAYNNSFAHIPAYAFLDLIFEPISKEYFICFAGEEAQHNSTYIAAQPIFNFNDDTTTGGVSFTLTNDNTNHLINISAKGSSSLVYTRKAKNGNSVIAPASGDTPGSGTVELYHWNSGVLVDDSVSITAYNNSPSLIPAYVYLDLIQEPTSGKYFICFAGEEADHNGIPVGAEPRFSFNDDTTSGGVTWTITDGGGADNAVHISGNTGGGGGGADSASLGTDFTCPTTYTNTALHLILPNAGLYDLRATVTGFTSHGEPIGNSIIARLHDGTNPVSLSAMEVVTADILTGGGATQNAQTTSIQTFYTASGATTITLQGMVEQNGGTTTSNATIQSSNATDATTCISYIKH